jgi:hypothetical protein
MDISNPSDPVEGGFCNQKNLFNLVVLFGRGEAAA